MSTADEALAPVSLGVASSPQEILDRMEAIVANEALVHGKYAVEGTGDRSAPCGGAKFCAYGALVFASGAKYDPLLGDLEGTVVSRFFIVAPGKTRDEFASRQPHLATARAALNAVAQEYIDSGRYGEPYYQNGVDYRHASDALEILFECCDGVDRDTLLAVIAEARGRLVHDG